MSLPNREFKLRPRFAIPIVQSKEYLLERLSCDNPLIIKTRVDDHIFYKIPRSTRTLWSPQLHIRLEEQNDGPLLLHGLFGPSPTLWTLFMFVHFGLAVLFVLFGVLAYSNWSLHASFAIYLWLMTVLVGLWVLLYILGRIGKHEGKEEMILLYNHLQECIDTEAVNKVSSIKN